VDGCAEVDSYVGQRYTVPVTPAPDALLSKALDVVVYCVFMRRGIRLGTADESIVTKYKFAVAWLRDVAHGKASIPNASSGDGGTGTVVSKGSATISASPRVFSRDSLKDF
jgi:phage gp36-like protein